MANSMWGKRLKLKLSTINILRATTLLQLKSEHFHSYGNVYCNGIEIGVLDINNKKSSETIYISKTFLCLFHL